MDLAELDGLHVSKHGVRHKEDCFRVGRVELHALTHKETGLAVGGLYVELGLGTVVAVEYLPDDLTPQVGAYEERVRVLLEHVLDLLFRVARGENSLVRPRTGEELGGFGILQDLLRIVVQQLSEVLAFREGTLVEEVKENVLVDLQAID